MGCDKQKEKGEERHELYKLRPNYSKNCKLRTGTAHALVLSILMKEILPILELVLQIKTKYFHTSSKQRSLITYEAERSSILLWRQILRKATDNRLSQPLFTILMVIGLQKMLTRCALELQDKFLKIMIQVCLSHQFSKIINYRKIIKSNKKTTRINFSCHVLDKRFLSLGFGGTVNGRTSHCFPLNGNSRDPYCYGIEGIIDAYYSSLEHGKSLRNSPTKEIE